ncbi:MAG: hypothetical protein IKQ70_15625 [Bacteroidales bacterium]|nr:hypothetical protein [Bacteroidales bacterium]
MNTMTIHSPGQLIVDVEDISLLKNLKNAISMLKGVAKVTIPRRQKLSSYELALKDLDEGRVYEYNSLDELINEIENGN